MTPMTEPHARYGSSGTFKQYHLTSREYDNLHTYFPKGYTYWVNPAIDFTANGKAWYNTHVVLVTSYSSMASGDRTVMFPADEEGFPTMAINLRKDDNSTPASVKTVFDELAYKEVV